MPFQCPWDVGSMGRLYVDLHFCWLIHMVILYTSIYLLNATCMRLMDLSWGFGIENLNFDMHSGERVFSVDIPIHVWYTCDFLDLLFFGCFRNNSFFFGTALFETNGTFHNYPKFQGFTAASSFFHSSKVQRLPSC